MSEFTSAGGEVFPNCHSDAQEVFRISEWSDEALEHKLHEYGAFMQRDDLMPRAIKTANYILDRLIFEQAYRDDVYEHLLKTPEEIRAGL
jgi:hypothetical protein